MFETKLSETLSLSSAAIPTFSDLNEDSDVVSSITSVVQDRNEEDSLQVTRFIAENSNSVRTPRLNATSSFTLHRHIYNKKIYK